MALAYKTHPKEIVIRFRDGQDKSGKDILKSITFDNVNPEITDDKVIEFFEGVKGLSKTAFRDVRLVEPKTIVQQA